MKCPFCSHFGDKVVDKRDNEESNITRRRRECLKCQKRFTTYERIENINLQVIKRGGNLEEFNREKLKQGVMKAVGKRPVSEQQIDELIADIEMRLLNRQSSQIKSIDIGKMVLTRLKKLDKLGYILFCTVYNQFKTIEDLKKEINSLN